MGPKEVCCFFAVCAPRRQGLVPRLRLDNVSSCLRLVQLIQSVAVRLDPCRPMPSPYCEIADGTNLRPLRRAVLLTFIRVLQRHVVVFSVQKRPNRRYGAGGKGVVALEAVKGFL